MTPDTTEDAPVAFAHWCKLSAMSTALDPEAFAALLEREEIESADYAHSEEVHLAAIAEGIRRGDLTLASQHARACVEVRPDEEAPMSATLLPGPAAPKSLPFSGQPSSGFMRSLQAAPAAEADVGGETIMAKTPMSGQTLPFDRSASVPSLENYAALCAEIAARPSEVETLRKRFGLRDERSHAALDRYYLGVFRLAPEKRARFERMVAERLAALRRGG